MKMRKAAPADMEILGKAFDLKPAEIPPMMSSTAVCAFAAGETVVREGEKSADVYVVLTGSLSVRRARWVVLQDEIAQLKTGDLFGEIGFLVPGARTASVVALGPCEVARLASHAFNALMDEKSALRARVEEQARERIYVLAAAAKA